MKMPLSNYIWIFIFISLYTSLKTAPVIGLAKISRLVIHTDSKIHTNTITHIQRESVKWTFQVKACLLFICMFLTCIPIHVFHLRINRVTADKAATLHLASQSSDTDWDLWGPIIIPPNIECLEKISQLSSKCTRDWLRRRAGLSALWHGHNPKTISQ